MRAELLGQCVGAQFELERSIAEVPPAARGEGEQHLRALKDLQRQIGRASLATLQTLRAEITSTVAVAHCAVQQARTAAAAETSVILAELAHASREQVTALMRDMHRFDGDLRFASPEDETVYRQREAERRAYIEAQHAKDTQAGNLNAAGGAIGQMVDAHAHGAGKNAAFQQRWNDLVVTTENLRDAARASGVSTEEFDRNLRDDLRRIMKAKGLSDAEINARFAAQADPLEAAKAIVQSDSELQMIRRSIERAKSLDAPVSNEDQSDMRALIASLPPGGIPVPPEDAAQSPSHGLPVRSAQPTTGRTI